MDLKEISSEYLKKDMGQTRIVADAAGIVYGRGSDDSILLRKENQEQL